MKESSLMQKGRRLMVLAMSILLAAALVMPAFAVDTTSGSALKAEVGSPKSELKKSVSLLTDTGGLGDRSFNDLAYKGLTTFSHQSGMSLKVLQAKTADDYLPNLVASAEEKSGLIYGVGFLFSEVMKEAADKYPGAHFVIIDSVVDRPNVASVVFKEEEGSYLVGVAAGLATKSNKIGFVSGIDMPLIKRFEVGFRAGVASVNPRAKVTNVVANSFSDVEQGAKIAKELHKKGVDVVYSAAGGVTIGIAQVAAKENFWFIGTDVDQSALAPRNTLCSMVKKIDVAAADVAQKWAKGNFKGGLMTYGIKENGVGYSDQAGRLSSGTVKVIHQFRQAVASGQIVVPSTEQDLAKFKKPSIKFQKPARVTNK